jgi:hypothetical protein
VKYVIHITNGLKAEVEVGEVPLHPFVVSLHMIQVGSVTRGQVISDPHSVPLVDQGLDQV